MNFQTYSGAIFCTLEHYMSSHTDSQTDLQWLYSIGWVDDTYRPIYEAYTSIGCAQTNEDLLIALQWASHLDHYSGDILDYCYVEHIGTVRDKLQQNGLDKTFPHWETEITEVLGGFILNDNLPTPDMILDYVQPRCPYCNEITDDEDEKIGCASCISKIKQHGLCIYCSSAIGFYGDLCYSCATSCTYTMPLI